jgi:phage regulator Rha-like protein
MAIYSNNQIIGVNPMTNNTDNNWNQNEELRALASFIVRIKAANRNKNIIIAVRNRKGLSIIVFKTHSAEVKGFHITSVIFQLHSIIFIAV